MPGVGHATPIDAVVLTIRVIGGTESESHQRRLEFSVGNLQRHAKVPESQVIASASSDELTDRLPTFLDFVTLVRWPEGDLRTTGTVLLFCEDGLWKASLHDRDGARTVFVSAGGLLELLSVCDEALAAQGTPWRPDRNRKK